MKNPFENLQFIPEANIILHANYTVFKKKEEEKKNPYSDFPFLTSPTGSGLQPLLLFVPIPTNPLSHLSPVMVASLLLLIQERHVLPEGFYILFVLPVKYLRSVTHTGAPCLYDWPAVQNASVRPMGLLETEQLRSVTWVWHAYMTGLHWKPWTSRPRLASLDDNSSRTLSHITAGELSIVHTTPLEEDNLKLMPGFF